MLEIQDVKKATHGRTSISVSSLIDNTVSNIMLSAFDQSVQNELTSPITCRMIGFGGGPYTMMTKNVLEKFSFLLFIQ